MTIETMQAPTYALAPGQLNPALVESAAWLLRTLVQRSRVSGEAQTKYLEAVDRAVAKLLAGAQWRIDGETVRFLSESEAKRGRVVWHDTTAQGCDCRGSEEGKVCWNRPARWMLLRLAEWLAPLLESEPARFWVVCTDGQDHGTPRLATEAELEELQENAQVATDGTWWWMRLSAEQASLLTQEPEPEAPAPAQAEPERQAARPYPRLYVCPNDHGTMIETVAPGGDPIVECQSCGRSVDQAQAGALEPLPALEARGVARAYGRAA